MEYNGRTHFIIQTSSIGPVLSICKVYTEHIMEFFVMRNEINKILEFVFYVKTDVSPLSTCMSKICKQEL